MRKLIQTIMVTLMLPIFVTVTASTATAAVDAKPLPIDYWAIRDAVSAVSLSPDGKHVLILNVPSKTGEHLLDIYKTDDFSKPFRRTNADPMEFISARWVSDEVIVGTAWKVVRKRVRGPEEDVRSYKFYAYNIKTNKFSEADGSFQIVENLPNEPDHVLIATGRAVDDGVGVDPFAAFRPRAYYRFNLKNGSRSLVMKGNEKYPQASFDINGNPRYTQGLDPATNEIVTYYRKPGDSSWTEFGKRYDADKHENLYRILSGIHGLAGFKHDDPSIGYILDNPDGDKVALYEFNFDTGQLGKKLYENPDADVLRLQFHSNYWGGNQKMVAAIYSGEKHERYWFDEEEKQLHEEFEAKIPYAHSVSIGSRSRDGNTMIVTNRGPRDPGSYWLVKDGKMAKLASRNPLVKPEDLADVKYIRYTARDGLTIPAYVTMPKGEGPHPLIVLPHGGPHVNEVITYDEWGQFLANNGYMVLQPQYRISTGWGQKHFDAGYGEHGLAMQDDKDDGALYLVEKGWADPNRMAMFGWSYGGYAALVAATRDPNVYQCTIAGAAVADAKKVYMKRSKGGGKIKAIDDWARRRGGFVGINPIEEVEDINIPVMMVHGDWDARVLYFNFKDYRKEVERVAKTKSSWNCDGNSLDSECTMTITPKTRIKGKEDATISIALEADDVVMNPSIGDKSTFTSKNKFVTLKGADHFYRTLMYEHQYKLYTEMLDFLQNDCGPGGL